MDIVSKSGNMVGTPVPDHQKPSEISLALNSQHKPIPNLDNVVRILEHYSHWEAQIWFDSFRQRIFTTYDCESPREWQDTDDMWLTLWIQRCVEGLEKVNRQNVSEAVQIVAMAHQRDSLQEWLTQLKWDGELRIDLFFSRAFGAGYHDYMAAISRNFLISLVVRGLDPGCQVDTCPILEGFQGIGKSSGLRALIGPEWFAEAHQDLMSKDFFITLQGKWLIEISEMDAFSRAEVERVKGVITCRSDRYRRPYGKHAHDHPRRCVFAGTTNRDDWNRDETGARRFWPVACSEVDVQWIEQKREQLFAEAVAAFNAGEQWWITDPKISEQARTEQDDRRAADTWEEPILEYLKDDHRTKMADILDHALGIEPRNQGWREQNRVAKILRANGWERDVVREGDKTVRIWKRDVTPLSTDVSPLLPP